MLCPLNREKRTRFAWHCVALQSLTAVHLPRPGLAGLRAGEDGLHAEQQAQGDLPGDAVGLRARRAPAGGGHLRGLSRGWL